MPVISYHTLALSCERGENADGTPTEHYVAGSQTFTGRTLHECQRRALAKGWRFYDHGTKAICPDCTKEGYKWQKSD